MSELYFLPTPNWFISRPLDIYFNFNKNNDILALSVIGSIYLFDYKFKQYYDSIKNAHLKRINSLTFKKSRIKNDICLLASCSDDLTVKVWDVNSKVVVKEHQFHLNIPSCLDWLDIDGSDDLILISGDVKGNIFKWNLNNDSHVRYFPENRPITQLKSCKNKHLISIGYKHGTIVILNIQNDQMKILFKLKSHEDAINYLFWYPMNKFNEQFDYEFKEVNDNSLVLCSSSEDKTIRIWSIENGAQIKSLMVPIAGGNGKGQQQKSAKINFIPLCWPTPRYILSASYNGELFCYDLNENENQGKKWSTFRTLKDKSHKKVIYDISFYNNTIITLSLDKLINIWDLKTLSQENSLQTLNGFIYSIISSPVDPSLMAISVGDSSIKIFNETKTIDKNIKSYSNNIKAEVTQIAWHPIKETLLAFGTKDGKVGIIDISSNNKPAHYLYSNYNQSVYTLLWSPSLIPGDQYKSQYALYSVADGRIMQHLFKFSQNTVVNIENLNFYDEILRNDPASKVQCGLTELSILNENSEIVYFTIGKFDGSIELYKLNRHQDKLTKLCTFLNHNKLITIIKWNKTSSYLASGSNDYNVVIIDFKSLIESLENLSENSNLKLISKYKHKLVGHRERITGLSWSLHDENMLASCSFDSTVQIWDAANGIPIANYRGHGDKVFCCLFSNCEANIVYSGGEDYALHVWSIDKQPNKLPPEECSILIGKKKKQFFKKTTKKTFTTTDSTNKSANKPEEDEEQEIEETELESIVSKIDSEKDIKIEKSGLKIEPINGEIADKRNISPPIQPLQPTSSKKSDNFYNTSLKIKDYKQILPLSSKAHRLNKTKSLIDCLVLFESIYENPNLNQNDYFEEQFELIDLNFNLNNNNYSNDDKQQFLNLYLFGNRKSTSQLLNIEYEELNKSTQTTATCLWLFDVWRGNIEKLMFDLESENLLNDFFFTIYQLSITPTIYQDNKFFENYLKQLLASNEYHKVAIYYIVSYKIHDAIELYLQHNQFQFALCLAQLRLNKTVPRDYELFKSVLFKYAAYCNQNGDYETAALVYIRLKDLVNASKVLIRRSTNDEEQINLIKNLTFKFSKKDLSICLN